MSKKSVRLFSNNFLESLTHVHPIIPLLFWTPVVLFLLWRSIFVHDLAVLSVAAIALPSILVWTLTEYLFHRFVFHYQPKSAAGKWLIYLFHGVHHDDPTDKTRLVMPPAGAVLIMSLFWLFFASLIPAPWIEPFFAFFLIGYLAYDYLHYAVHHFRMKHPLLQALKHSHMQHHFSRGKTAKYGVSSPLWDWIFGTRHHH